MVLSRRRRIVFAIVLAILLIPLIAMQFTSDVSWGLFDFMVAGMLLVCAGLTIEYASRKMGKSKFKVFTIAAIILVFIAIWVEMAVGIFNSPLAGN